jgi:type II secretory pathway component GspD/PulD (secretin)
MTRNYDVADFIRPARPDDQPDPTPKRLSADMPIGARSISRSEARDGLVAMVRETIDPKSWAPSGPATLEIRDDTLVITQTAQNHRNLATLFAQLRESETPPARLHAKFQAARLPAATRFDNAELASAVDSVAKATGVPIRVDWPSLARVQITSDAAVSTDVSKQSAPRALRALIRAAAPPTAPDFSIETRATPDAVRVLAAPAPRADQTSSRVYDVRHLPARAAGLDPQKDHPRQEVLDALVATVKRNTNVTAVRETNGHLIVTAPDPAHELVTQFLDQYDGPPPEPQKKQ